MNPRTTLRLICASLLLVLAAGGAAGAPVFDDLSSQSNATIQGLSSDDPSTTATGEVGLELRPANITVEAGNTTALDVVITDPEDGISAYSLNVSVGDTGVATVDGFELDRATFDDSFVTADNSTAVLDVALGQDVYSPATEITVATVNLTAVGGPGDSTTVAFEYNATGSVINNSDAPYTVTSNQSATLDITSDPVFEVTDLQPTDASVVEGELVNVTATVENLGGPDTQTVGLSVGNYTDSREVSLGAGENQTVDFGVNTSTLGPGAYEHTVSTDNDTASGNLTVLESATFTVAIQEANDTVEGEDLNVTVQVENVGGPEDTQTIALDVGALGSAETNVTLGSGNTTTLTFSLGTSSGDAGEYTATVTSADDSDNTTVTVLSSPDEVGLELRPSDTAVQPGGNVTLDIVVTGPSAGIGAYTFNVTVNQTDVATVSDYSLDRSQFDDSFITEDGQTLALAVALGDNTYDPAQNITVATVDLSADGGPGNATDIGFVLNESDAVQDADQNKYTVTSTGSATLDISSDPVFVVADLQPADASVVEGELVNVTATIENLGGPDTQTVGLSVGNYTDSQAVSLGAGENQTVDFGVNTSTLGPGAYEHTVSTDNDTASGNLTVLESATFTVAIQEANDTAEGNDLNVTVQVENVGGPEDTQTVALDVGALGSAETNVTLGSGNATTLTFSVGTSSGDADEYTATVTSADDSDSTTVAVLSPSGEVGLELRPSDPVVAPGGNVTLDIVVTGANEGINSFAFNVTVSDTATAVVDGFALNRSQFDNSFVTEDGKTLVLAVALGDNTYDPAQNITVATVDLAATGETNDSATVGFEYTPDDAVQNVTGTAYTVASDRPAGLEVGLPSLPEFETPPRDPDGDGRYEDVDGDGLYDIFDVQALFDSLNTNPVQQNQWAYDFDNDGLLDIFDVQTLFKNL